MLTIDPDHDPKLQQQLKAAGHKSTVVSIWVNLILTTLQVVAGIITGASSLIADGVHSLSDLISDFVVLTARHFSQKEADEDHPYGHHRYENTASLFLGLLLFLVALGMLYTAAGKIQNHEQLHTISWPAIAVASLTLLMKEGLFRYMIQIAQRARSQLLIANAWHARSDAASSLVVLIGLVGTSLGYPIFDPIAALIVGLMIGKMGLKFMWESLHDLMDRTVNEDTLVEIKHILLKSRGIRGLHDLKARKMGDLLLVDVHLEVDGKLSVEEGHQIALEARLSVMKNPMILDVMTHVDPV